MCPAITTIWGFFSGIFRPNTAKRLSYLMFSSLQAGCAVDKLERTAKVCTQISAKAHVRPEIYETYGLGMSYAVCCTGIMPKRVVLPQWAR